LGIQIDEAANEKKSLMISNSKSKVSVLVIPTDEEGMIAKSMAVLIEKQFSN